MSTAITPRSHCRSRSFTALASGTSTSPDTRKLEHSQETLIDSSSFVSLLNLTQKKYPFPKKLGLIKRWWTRQQDISPLPLIPSDITPPHPHEFTPRRQLKRSFSNEDLEKLSDDLVDKDFPHSESDTHFDMNLSPYSETFNQEADQSFLSANAMPNTLAIHNQFPSLKLSIPSQKPELRDARLTPLTPEHKLSPSCKHIYSCEKFKHVGQYKSIGQIGHGSFSTVELAIDTITENQVAIKFISKQLLKDNPQMSLAVENEISIMKSLDHPNIVKLLDSFETREDVCIVQEYVESGELYGVVANNFEKFNQKLARHVFKQLCQAVEYLHFHKICHRDLKLENVLVDNKFNVKLTDFGFSKRFQDGVPLVARCGSEEYASPEIILGIPYDGRKLDVWALGVILFGLLTGELPFIVESGEKPKAMYHRIARGEFRFPDERRERLNSNALLSAEAKVLIKCMLKQNASKRYFVRDILNHPWMTASTLER